MIVSRLSLWPVMVGLALCLDTASVSANEDSSGTVDPLTLPRYIAVLPATGEGSGEERNDIRLAIHNALGATNYELVKPNQLDRQLQALFPDSAEDLAERLGELGPAELARRLKVDGLVLAHVDNLERLYAAAYAHYQIEIEVRLYSAAEEGVVWRYRDRETKREGGVSVDPLGFIATAISSGMILSDAVRLQLTDTLARRYAKKVPQPPLLVARPKPPRVESALTNTSEGPFNAGDEIRLLVQAESGLTASFAFDGDERRFSLTEEQEGWYTGRYIVQPGDDYHSASLLVVMQRGREEPVEWPVPGKLTIDTQAPEPVTQLSGVPRADHVNLSWRAEAEDGSRLSFILERAEKGVGQFATLQQLDLTQYRDQSLTPGKAYIYRITAVDAAGNRSEARDIRVETQRYGPTEVTGDIRSDTQFAAVGSPYHIKDTVRVLKGVTLTIEAGSVLELASGAVLEVLGDVVVDGSANNPVVFDGGQWRIHHRYNPAVTSRYRHVQFRAQQAVFAVENAAVSLEGCVFRRTALELAEAEVEARACHWEENATAIHARSGVLRVRDSVFKNNRRGIMNADAQLELSGNVYAGNDMHLFSKVPVTLTSARFPEDDFLHLKDRLSKTVTVDWAQVPDEYNLQRHWLDQNWLYVAEAIQRGEWYEARQRLQPALDIASEPYLRDIVESLYLLQNPVAQPPAALDDAGRLLPKLVAMRSAGMQPGLIWLPAAILEQYDAFNAAYLNHYHGKAIAGGVLDWRPLDLQRFVQARIPAGHRGELGNLYLVDDGALTGALKTAGIIRRPPLLEAFHAVQPARQPLCDATEPWVLGEEPITADNPLRSGGCLSLRVQLADDALLYLFAMDESNTLVQLLPDRCGTTGFLSHHFSGERELAIPRNRHERATVIPRTQWPYARYYAVALESDREDVRIRPLVESAAPPCEAIAKTTHWDESELQRILQLADRRSGGRVQWQRVEIAVLH